MPQGSLMSHVDDDSCQWFGPWCSVLFVFSAFRGTRFKANVICKLGLFDYGSGPHFIHGPCTYESSIPLLEMKEWTCHTAETSSASYFLYHSFPWCVYFLKLPPIILSLCWSDALIRGPVHISSIECHQQIVFQFELHLSLTNLSLHPSFPLFLSSTEHRKRFPLVHRPRV